MNSHVQPGDVISSDLINQILDRLDALEVGSSPGTGPTITNLLPTAGVEIGNLLTIEGLNLPFPPTPTSVRLGSVFVPVANYQIASSNPTRLALQVPNLGALPVLGQELVVRVTTGDATTQRAHRFFPDAGGPATPDIDDIRALAASPPPAPAPPTQIGSLVIIRGSNFSNNPANNTITFRPPLPSQTYPTAANPLDIQSTSPTEIVVRVPDMAEVVVGPARRISVSLTVSGAPDSAVGEFFAFRT